MSIYATLWTLRFPRYGDDHTGCDWIDVLAQGVPQHVGLDDRYEEDPFAAIPRRLAPIRSAARFVRAYWRRARQ